MKKISIEEAVALLQREPYENAMDLYELQFLQKNNRETFVYHGEDVLIYASRYHTADPISVTVIPLCASWNWEETMAFLQSVWDRMNLLVRVQKLSETDREACKASYAVRYPFRKAYTTYAAEPDAAGTVHENVRLLTPDDKEAFTAMDWEPVQYRPDPARLFDIFVTKGAGKILACLEEGKVLGFLSYDRMFDNWYGVDYIYTIPGRTGQGIGTALAEAYVYQVKQAGGIPVYDNPQVEASRRIALKSGFILLTEKYRFAQD